MDADALIKFTKCGAKEELATLIDVTIPTHVKEETVDLAMPLGYPDAAVISDNIGKGLLKVAGPDPGPEPPQADLFSPGGDRALYLMSGKGAWDAVVSDDAKLLRLLDAIGAPVITPAALLVALAGKGSLSTKRTGDLLEALGALVSPEEYISTRLTLDVLKAKEGEE